jgi:AmmeMemoRadiSam system protein B
MGLGPAQTSLNIGRRAAEICVALGRKTLVIGSTDLTHYGYNYGYSPKGTGNEAVQWVKNVNDRSIVNRMLELDGKGVIEASLRMHNACCGGAAGASIEAAKALGSKKAEELVYSTSFDIRPDTSFVGYVGLVFSTAS